jgi:hypothetical protein
VTRQELVSELEHVNHSKARREYYSQLFIRHPENIPLLIDIAFDPQIKNSFKALWVLEFMCSADIILLTPHLDLFSSHLHDVSHDSAKRPMAKICEMIAVHYHNRCHHAIQKHLRPIHRERMIEACFDWMISDEKVAVKAYAMNALYLLGIEYAWVHPELQMILEKDFASQSPAFKARARHILKRLKSSK